MLVTAFLGGWILTRPHTSEPVADRATQQARAYLALEAREQAADATVWKQELEAEAYEDFWLQFWDALNQTTNAISTVRQFVTVAPVLPSLPETRELDWNIQFSEWRGPFPDPMGDPAAAWSKLLQRWRDEHWELGRTSWHLIDHRPATPDRGARSTVEFRIPALRRDPQERACIQGHLIVDWEMGLTNLPKRLIATNLNLMCRSGPDGFVRVQATPLAAPEARFGDPLLALDFDGDGYTDFLTLGSGQWWHNRPAPPGTPGGGRLLVPELWNALPHELVWAAALADLDGDGVADLVLAGAKGLSLLPGRASGGFELGPPRLIWPAPTPLRHPQVLAIGDIDGDGLPEVWIGQYKLPYFGGQFPTPFFDANDGFPSYVLHNDGGGHFSDQTAAAGLGGHRNRRVYSASFLDIKGNGFPALVTVSDFAGVDFYANDGHGRFRELPDPAGNSHSAFGMSHVVADFNGDGLPDVGVIGMNSVVADRLNGFHLIRDGTGVSATLRAAMTVGNRRFLSRLTDQGTVEFVPVQDPAALARTGWSWGAAWGDFNNSRKSALVVATGHDTQARTLDYERQFWRHDLYVANSTHDPVADLYFRSATGRRRADQASYGGWQHHAFVAELAAGHWEDISWLLGFDFPADGRNLIVDDLDGDGRLDVVLLTEESWPVHQRRLVVFRNQLPHAGHWIGVRLDADQRNPVGARVVAQDTSGTQTRWILAGDSYRSQSAPAVHFGLGTNTLRSVSIDWPDGRKTRNASLKPDGWHVVRP